jgi:hypothetical protein
MERFQHQVHSVCSDLRARGCLHVQQQCARHAEARDTFRCCTRLCDLGRTIQVAGHFLEDGRSSLIMASDGTLLKPLQADGRGFRELFLYACAEMARDRHTTWCMELMTGACAPPGWEAPLTDEELDRAISELTGAVFYIPRCSELPNKYAHTGQRA